MCLGRAAAAYRSLLRLLTCFRWKLGPPFQEKRPMTGRRGGLRVRARAVRLPRRRLGPRTLQAVLPYPPRRIPSMTLRRPRRQQRHLMATASGGRFGQAPANSSLALAATERTTASSRPPAAVLFPRPGSSTLGVTPSQGGHGGLQLSWESQSMQPRAPIPPSHLCRPLPLSKTEYPIYIEPDATHPPTSTANGRMRP